MKAREAVWSPEMEMIDQLLGDAMPIAALGRFFSDDDHYRRVLAIYVDRDVVVLARDGAVLPRWEAVRLLREDAELFGRSDISVSLTEAGGTAFDSGGWNSVT